MEPWGEPRRAFELSAPRQSLEPEMILADLCRHLAAIEIASPARHHLR